jgi:small subunit ribosomal protein S1
MSSDLPKQSEQDTSAETPSPDNDPSPVADSEVTPKPEQATTDRPTDESADSPPAETPPQEETAADSSQESSAEAEPTAAEAQESAAAESEQPAETESPSEDQAGEATTASAGAGATDSPAEAASEEKAAAESKSASLREKMKQAQAQESDTAQAVPSDEPEVATQEEAPVVHKGPVEIPKEAEEFDAEMEAEIEAALASGEVGEPAPAPSAEEQESATEESEEPAAPTSEEELVEGMSLSATVQSVDDDNVFLDLGFRSPGIVSRRQFSEKNLPHPGVKLLVRFNRLDPAEGLIHVDLPHGKKKVSGNWDELRVGQVVDCTVNKTNKGGLEVTVGSLRAFMPAGQVDLIYHADLEPFVGQKLQACVLEVKPAKRNLVVSRKAYLEIERKEKAKTLWQELEVGQVLTGMVKNLKDYGAFIDIGGADGFLHIGEMSWQHIKHPKDLLKEGLQVEVQIISLEPERSRIGLSLKTLQKDPWMVAAETYGPGTIARGKVTRTAKFGAFVELPEGVEGLVHISELSHARVGRVTEVVKVGQEIDVKVLSVDPDQRRMSLSIKELTAAPEPARDEDLAPSGDSEYTRKRKGPLKGGIGGTGKGGLFGDPDDFED